ncbi:DNA/RNA helicase [Lottiidibacillus patelloidae]|uniref:DNA/RNA helicase n=1 Tax=Lottiidibacillus patelloidae TaxID=2670334 RepID=A0A263BTK4_9BACI|nr:DEAD/DEAH box helicase [Lottiidibacillus patelloidae]OZM56516.1 DNA/RNA helicase [Lottiidibacillus patelloidae]
MKFASFSVNEKIFIRPVSNNETNGLPISSIKEWSTNPINVNYRFNGELQGKLEGRRLLLEQLDVPLEEIHEHVENGYIKYHKGITEDNNALKCNRCGNNDEAFFASYPCARCSLKCKYCRKCILMGRIAMCTALVSWCGPKCKGPEIGNIEMNWTGKLSLGQERASERVVNAILKQEDLLVWAVCGAGKTEVLLSGIKQALQMNMKICVASPRVDVIHELTPRFKNVFPNVEVISLYGGSNDRGKISNFVLATTHQLIHYYKYFDAIIIDEVDAFPYSYDEMLTVAVQNAKKEVASTVLLSATPGKAIRVNTPTIKIPARYHRSPLPVPSFCWIGDWKKKLAKNNITKKLYNWLKKRLDASNPIFVFVPSVEVMKKLVTILKKLDGRIESVYAEDKSRKEKVQQFREGKIPCLVTTTILERGVTVPNLHVAVYGSEESVFSRSALVQIAGRVGRSQDYPIGDVVFFHYGKSRAMVEARAEILAMNKEGKELGLLNEG